MLWWSLALLWVCLQRILQTFEIFNYKKLIFHPLLLPVLFNVQVMNKWHTDMWSFLPLVKSSKELSGPTKLCNKHCDKNSLHYISISATWKVHDISSTQNKDVGVVHQHIACAVSWKWSKYTLSFLRNYISGHTVKAKLQKLCMQN